MKKAVSTNILGGRLLIIGYQPMFFSGGIERLNFKSQQETELSHVCLGFWSSLFI